MDAIPVPERKRPSVVRASEEQLSILRDSFAVSSVLSKGALATLSERTGLTRKWISSWFMRERKKSTPKITQTTDKSKPSRQEIAVFKQEHSDSLTLTTDAVPKPRSEQQVIHSEKTTRQQFTRDLKDDLDVHLEGSLGSLKSPFRSVPAVTSLPRALTQTQPPDCVSPTSTFILRPMVPLMYQPRTIYPKVPLPPQHLNVTLEKCNDSSVSSCKLDSSRGSSEKLDHSHGKGINTALVGRQSSNACAPRHSTLNRKAQNPGKGCPYTYKLFQPFFSHSNSSHQPENFSSPCDYNRTFSDPMDKENHAPQNHSYILRPQPTLGQSPKLSLLYPDQVRSITQQPLDSDRYSSRIFAGSTTSDLPPQELSQAQQLPLGFVDPAQQAPSLVLDPTSTPLKHLGVLAPFDLHDLPHDVIIRRVLDERLVQEDPFQAAMGLVLASRLGLQWNPI